MWNVTNATGAKKFGTAQDQHEDEIFYEKNRRHEIRLNIKEDAVKVQYEMWLMISIQSSI